jgi:hypothetical protein
MPYGCNETAELAPTAVPLQVELFPGSNKSNAIGFSNMPQEVIINLLSTGRSGAGFRTMVCNPPGVIVFSHAT